MKKLLALVLALVMTLSLCTISNAAFTDAKDVTADYEEAVAVLNGMGVFKGYEDGSFKPTGAITRAEVAAIVYRLYTGDVKDKQADLYAGYGKFDDMAGAKWAAGYVGFCANAGFVKGYGNGKFGPSDPVTGYQALAMILRAVGYGKNGEFEGADWELHVAQIAQQLKVLKNVKAVSLKTAATRELVAELLFRVAADVATVTYTPAFGYVSDKFAADGKKLDTETLGKKNFKLEKSKVSEDDWGRPQYKWFADEDEDKKVDTKETVYATVKATPVASYTVATTYCDVCEELGEDDQAYVESVWNNGVEDTSADKLTKLTATATSKEIGAQGQLVEIYDDFTKEVKGEEEDAYRFVVIDTYLAKVTDVDDMTFDKNDHLKTEAEIDLDVYGHADIKLTSDKANFDYAKKDVVLVNINEKTLNKSVILGLAESVEGKATKYTGKKWASETVFVGDEEYNFAVNFSSDLDDCKGDGKLTYTWYLDQYGNVIGDALVETVYDYAVLKNLTWVAAKAGGHAVADLVYMDGTVKEDVVVETIDGDSKYDEEGLDFLSALRGGHGTFVNDAEPIISDKNKAGFNGENDTVNVATDGKLNGVFEGYAMYRVATNDDDEVALDVYDDGALFVIVDGNENGYIDNETGMMRHGGGKVAVADKDTKFIYRTEDSKGNYVYTAYTLEDLPEFVDGSVTFMAKVDDGVAEYVYILDAAEAGDQHKYFMPTSDKWVYDTKEKTYTVKGILDGEETEVVLDADDWTWAPGYWTNCVGKLFKIWTNPEGEVDDYGMVNYSMTDGVARYVYDTTATLINNIYTGAGRDYYVGKATVVGTKDNMTLAEAVKANTDGKDTTEAVGIWFVMDEDAKNNYTVKYIYLGKKLSEDVSATVTYNTDDNGKTTLTKANFAVTGTNAVYTKTLALDEKLENFAGKTYNSTVAPVDGSNAIVIAGGWFYNEWDGAVKVSLTSGEAYTATVWAEDGKTNMEYKWTVTNGNDTVLCNDLTLEEVGTNSWLTEIGTDDVIVTINGYETLTVENLLAALEVKRECVSTLGATHTEDIKVYDNGVELTTGSLKDFVDDDDLTIVVTNETANTKTYHLKVKENVVEYSITYNGCTGANKAAADTTVAVKKGAVPVGRTVMFAVSSGSTTTYYYAQNDGNTAKELTVNVVMPAGNTSISAVLTESDPVASVTVDNLNRAERSTLAEGTVFKGKMTAADITAFNIPDASKDKYVGWKLANGTGTNQASLTITKVGGWTATYTTTTAKNTITLGTAVGEVFTTNDTPLGNGQYNWTLAIGTQLYTGTFWITENDTVSFSEPV